MLTFTKHPDEHIKEIKKNRDAIIEAFELVKNIPLNGRISFDYSEFMSGHIYPNTPLTEEEVESILDWASNLDVTIQQRVSDFGEPYLTTGNIKLNNNYQLTIFINSCQLKSCKLVPKEKTVTQYEIVCSE